MAESPDPQIPKYLDPSSNVVGSWRRTVGELAVPSPTDAARLSSLEEGMKERHALFALVLMALVAENWNGNKYGLDGRYGSYRDGQRDPTKLQGDYPGGDYLGHNIAALAVERSGRIIDFDFNHNDMRQSTVEHAESRLVRRVFSLDKVYETWKTPARIQEMTLLASNVASPKYDQLMSDVTIYTSLESCAQCTGIMTLAGVCEVVYLQRDPGQELVGNILRNLFPASPTKFAAPLPVSADLIDRGMLGADVFDSLGTGFELFKASKDAFFVPNVGTPQGTLSVTSFLCTDLAKAVFDAGRDRVGNLKQLVRFPQYPVVGSSGSWPLGKLSNLDVVNEIGTFMQYLDALGKTNKFARRATPHTT